MTTIQIDWKALGIKALIIYGVTTLASYVFYTTYEKVIERPINKRVKAFLPILFSTVISYFLIAAPIPLKIVSGFIVGCATTTFYDWGVDKILKLMDGLFESFSNWIKEKLFK